MAHVNKVARSINDFDGMRCVDIFKRPDGSFGFAEYRRDVEDARGWHAIGGDDGARFETTEAAYEAALARVAWLAAVTRA